MKVYVDTNVLIDFVCRRAGFADAACIVTRNKKDFAHSSLPIYSPEELLEIFAISK